MTLPGPGKGQVHNVNPNTKYLEQTWLSSEVQVCPWCSHFAPPQQVSNGQPGLRGPCRFPSLPILLAGLTVNGQIIGDKEGSPDSKTRKTYFGKLGITNSQMDFRIEVTTEKITLWNGIAQSIFSWLDTVTVTQDG